jgi:hypothetical protein
MLYDVVCFLLDDSPAAVFYMPTFRNLCLFHLHTYPPMNMEQTECSETLAFKLQTPVNHPDESLQQRVVVWFISQLDYAEFWKKSRLLNLLLSYELDLAFSGSELILM